MGMGAAQSQLVCGFPLAALPAAKYLKRKNPDIHIVCVEPTESRVLVGEMHKPHTILGIGGGAVSSSSRRMGSEALRSHPLP